MQLIKKIEINYFRSFGKKTEIEILTAKMKFDNISCIIIPFGV